MPRQAMGDLGKKWTSNPARSATVYYVGDPVYDLF